MALVYVRARRPGIQQQEITDGTAFFGKQEDHENRKLAIGQNHLAVLGSA
jgi:hypothetical protein